MSHQFHPSTLREYDIRGVVGKVLGEADAHALGRSFGTLVARGGGSKVAVGYDGRISSPALEAALVEGLTTSGIDAVRIGLGPSPMLYYAEAVTEVDGGVQITGSHNPAEYNGFKLVFQGRAFFGEEIRDLARMAAAGDWVSGQGRVENRAIMDRYVARLVEGLDARPFRIGWDAGNGAAGPVVKKLVQLLPGEHHLLFTDIDGHFPHHHPDPTEERNLAQLRALVLEKHLDFGVAFDGDGDRIGVVDGTGRVLWGDQLLAIFAEEVLRDRPGATIITDVKASQALLDRIADLGGQPLMWKTGHSLIKSKMKQTGSPLAGDMSGHIFFGHRYYGYDDALYATVRLIGAASAAGGLASLCDRLPVTVNTPELRFPVEESRKFAVIAEVLARLRASGAEVSDLDGARVTTEDGWWLLRASNTQEVLVARAEARDEAGLQRAIQAIDSQLAESGVVRLTSNIV